MGFPGNCNCAGRGAPGSGKMGGQKIKPTPMGLKIPLLEIFRTQLRTQCQNFIFDHLKFGHLGG
jgi:hypothetical protein